MTAAITGSGRAAGLVDPPVVRPAAREVAHGRELEQGLISDLLRRARAGHGGVVLVEGEPGIGKSLLLGKAIDEAAEQGFSLAAGSGDQLGQAIPFFALRAALREPFAGHGAGRSGPGLPEVTAWWISQLGSHLTARARTNAVLVCLDDLQWENAATLTGLRSLPHSLKHQPIAWLLARSSTRQREAGYLFGQLESDGAARITLAPLAEHAVTATLTDVFGAPPDEMLADLALGAAGNPALLTQLAYGLRDAHAVRVIRDRAVLASDRLPPRIHRLVQRRVDDLSKQARHLVVTAAVLGPAFRLEDAAEMLGETPAVLLPAVEEAMDAAILAATEHDFRFRHRLVCRAVAELIPGPARTALHRQYGALLLARGESAVAAASHLLQAAQPGDQAALAGLDKAAAQTLASAPRVAADLAQRALELTPPVDPAALSRTLAALEALTAAGRLDQAGRIARDLMAKPLPPPAQDRLRCALSAMLCLAGEARDAADHAEVVLGRPRLPRDLRERALTAQLQALAGLREDPAGPRADAILSAASQHAGHVTEAALVTRAVVSWDSGHVSDALVMLRDAAGRGGLYADARRVQPILALAAALIDVRETGEATDILGSAGGLAGLNELAHATLLILRGRIQLAAGRLAEATADVQAGLASAQAAGVHAYAAAALSVLGLIELRRGDIGAAARHIASRPAAGPQVADIYARAETAMAAAQIAEARDGPAAVLGRLRQLCAGLPGRPGLLLGDPALAAWIARTALAAGDGKLAACAARAAQSLADAQPDLAVLATAAAHSRGLARGDPAGLACAAAEHPDPWARASAAEDLGVWYSRRGDREQAVGRLKQSLAGYRDVQAERDQARIRRRLRRLGVRGSHWITRAAKPVSGWDSLTGTEQAVASLVAEGLNNNQVAARMYISTHTVAHHLRQSFRKLSIASRVELTRIVIEQAARAPAIPAAGPPGR